jgi:hypothetical protein
MKKEMLLHAAVLAKIMFFHRDQHRQPRKTSLLELSFKQNGISDSFE